MSYFQGITDAELKGEGWSDAQISELRRAETTIVDKKAKAAEAKYRNDLAALNEKGASIYAQLVSSSHPWPRHMAASAARASQDPVPSPEFVYHVDPPRKWWQFWK